MIDWKLGMTTQPVQIKATQSGDGTAVFIWTGTHNVYLFEDKASFRSCDFSKAKELSSASGFVFTAQAGTFFFGCSIAAHCASGQKLRLKITGDEVKTGLYLSWRAHTCARMSVHSPTHYRINHDGAYTCMLNARGTPVTSYL